jgi:small-conductance mechanosensitive channel
MPPDFIRESELWGPLFALGVFAAMLLVAAIAQVVLQLVLKHRKEAAPEGLDTRVLQTVRGPLVLFLVIVGIFLGFTSLTAVTSERYDVLDGWDRWARKAWIVVVIAEVSYLASHLTQILIGWYLRTIAVRTSTDIDAKLLPPVRRILPLVVYSVATLVALDSIGIPISPLLAGFGIGGLAVALAVQPTLSNFFAGTYLVTEGELKEGDFIELEGGPAGFVVDVGWRSMKMRSRFNNLVIIPNSKMADSIVTNYFSPTPAMNVIVTSGVSYDADLTHVGKGRARGREPANRRVAPCRQGHRALLRLFGIRRLQHRLLHLPPVDRPDRELRPEERAHQAYSPSVQTGGDRDQLPGAEAGVLHAQWPGRGGPRRQRLGSHRP